MENSVVTCHKEGQFYRVGEVLWTPIDGDFLSRCECQASHSRTAFSCNTCKFEIMSDDVFLM